MPALTTRVIYTVATLPAVATMQGAIAYVNDSTLTEAAGTGAIAIGGGTALARVRSDGSSWRVYGNTRRGAGVSSVTFNFAGGTLPGGVTLTRASPAWYFNNTLALVNVGNDVARFAYDPAGAGLLGLCNEPAATNGIRNADAAGASAGTPGTNPTNWAGLPATTSNLTKSIVGTGVEDGIAYVDIRWNGTASASSSLGPQFEGNQITAALVGQVWTQSMSARLVGGTLAGLVSFQQAIQQRDGSGANLGTLANTIATPTAAALKTQRQDSTYTLVPAGTAFITSNWIGNYSNGAVIDATFRLGDPQLVLEPAATTLIRTSSVAVTRAADVLTLPLTPGTYSAIDIVHFGGGTTHLTNVVVGGGGYVVPNDPLPILSIVVMR
jgi:hypothetical protein